MSGKLSVCFPKCKATIFRRYGIQIPANITRKKSTSSNHLTKDILLQKPQFFDDIGKSVGLETFSDFSEKLNQKLFRTSTVSLIQEVLRDVSSTYPENENISAPWRFRKNLPIFWNSLLHQRQFFDWLGKELGVKQAEDWYSVLNSRTVLRYGGTFLVNQYQGSAIEALKAAYPDYNWIPWKFKSISQGFWKTQENQRHFFDWLGQQIGVKHLDDWYQLLSKEVVVKYGGSGILQYYDSTRTALMASYPHHSWDPERFKRKKVSPGFWDDTENITNLLSDLNNKLCIQNLDDWYRVDMKQLQKFRVAHIFQKNGGLYQVLQTYYPHHPWQASRFQTSGKKAQRWLLVTLKKIFTDEEILEDYLHPQICFLESKRPIQLDVFIPSKSLAFEYQGEHHYQNISVFHPQNVYEQRDIEKKKACAIHNIKLIAVPYWWDRTQSCLEQIIRTSQTEGMN